MIEIAVIAGARPNFVKIAPLLHALAAKQDIFKTYLVHTGQHHDRLLNQVFFEELNIPEPFVNLNVHGGSQAEQTGKIMMEFEKFLRSYPTIQIVIVVGDVNSTMACSIVAKKAGKSLVHIEAGIRSFDMTMPEEINRLLTDSICDVFYTTSEFANENLKKSGVADNKIEWVGNIMMDTLVKQLPLIQKPALFDTFGLKNQEYWLLTLHRPSNVDAPESLKEMLFQIDRHAHGLPIVFPVHPRTMQSIENLNLSFKNIRTCSPLSYREFVYLMKNAIGVITDSGGIQEETTFLNIPCLTLRKNTERPETVLLGSNELIEDFEDLSFEMANIVSGNYKAGHIPPLWDGKTAERIVQSLQKRFY